MKRSWKLGPGILFLLLNFSSVRADFVCPEEYGAYKNPDNCDSWYNCTGSVATLNTCPGGLRFNSHTLTCDWPSMTQCKLGEKVASSYSYDILLGVHHPHVRCPNHMCHCVFPHPTDCNKYYRCKKGKAYLMTCSEGLCFNPYKFSCDYPDDIDCEDDCEDISEVDKNEGEENTVCLTPEGLFPFDGDCTSYYFCSGGIAFVKQCPAGFHFSIKRRMCDKPERAGCMIATTEPTKPTKPTRPTRPTKPTKPTRPTKPTKPTEATEPTRPTRPTRPPTKPPVGNICLTPDGLFPDPNDCNSYFTCVNGNPIKSKCPANLHFNPAVKLCDWPEKAGCVQVSSTPSPLEFVCPLSQGLFPNPKDCHSFYHCDHNTAYLKDCPGNLHFNPDLLVCDWPENAGCELGEKPKPPEPPTEPEVEGELCECDCCIKPDPDDCQRYFKCFNHKAYHGSCSGGLLFNPEIDNCDLKNNVECPEPEFPPTFPPPPAFECPDSQGLFSNPDDCGSFFHCDHGLPHFKKCPANLHFNPTLMVCDWPESAGCEEGNRPIVPPPPPTGNPDPGLECHCSCCILPNKNDCSSFYRCNNGQAFVQTCPEGLLFNPEINSCDFASNVKCLSPTQLPPTWFECPKSQGLFSNPADCGSFYHCDHNVAYLKSCPASLHFNSKLLVCDWPENAGCIDPSVIPRPPVPIDGSCPCNCCLLPDKDDCNAFYFCNDGKLNKASCSEGLDFNPHSQNCEPKGSFKCTSEKPSQFECPLSQGLFPRPGHCTTFYHCDHSTAYLKHCPPGLHFNPKLKVCDWPGSAGCETSPGKPTNPLCQSGDGLYRNPDDCSTFYSCSGGRAHLMNCPANLHFRPETQQCDWPEKAGCKNTKPEPEKPNPEKPEPEKPVTGPFKCPESNGYFSNPQSCESFYQCANNVQYLQKCPPGTHFSPKKLVCDWPDKAGCKSDTKPPPVGFQCLNPSGLYPNPIDCRTFYHCSNGFPFLKECPANLHFNPVLLVCDWRESAGCGDEPEKPIEVVDPVEEPDNGGGEDTKKCPDKSCVCRVPDANDCSSFYQCKDGNAFQRRCPQGLRFNEKTEMCDLPKNVNCQKG